MKPDGTFEVRWRDSWEPKELRSRPSGDGKR
jgi:hypothetical protein